MSFGSSATSADLTKNIGLPAGNYYVKVIGSAYYSDTKPYLDNDYQLTVSHAAGNNYEVEFNDTIATATPINLGAVYTGNIAGRATLDTDYYKFTIPTPGKYNINFKHASIASSNSYWSILVTNSDEATSFLASNSAGSVADITKEFSIALTGVYHVKIMQGTSWSDIDYTLKVSPVQDITPPTIISATPANSTTNAQLTTPIIITFSEMVDPVTINSAKLLKQGNIYLPGTGVFSTGNSNNSIYTFTPSAPFSFSTSYTYTIDGVKDYSGNVLASPYSAGFTTIAKPVNVIIPTLSLALSTSSTLIANSSPVTLSGVMAAGSNNLTGQAITITITKPDASVIKVVLTSDSKGAFSTNLRGNLDLAGRYTIQASAGTVTTSTDTSITTIAPSTSSPTVLRVLDQNGKAIIVIGSITSGEGEENHAKTALRAKNALIARGFAEADITTITSIPGNSGKQALIDAMAAAKAAITVKPSSLHLILVDHGDKGQFHMDSEVLTPSDLGTLLDTFENGLSLQALDQPRYITIGACYSGSFIPIIAKSGRTIITSAKESEQSFRGPMEPDGIRSGEYFMDEYYGSLKKGASIRDAFNSATASVAMLTRRGGIVSSFGDLPLQNPLVSVNGGSGYSWLPTGFDDNAPETLYLGSGDDTAYNPSGMLPTDRVAKVEAIFLDNTVTTATISISGTLDQKAWFELRAPSNKLTQSGGSNQLDVVLPRVDMTWNSTTNMWSATYAAFYEFGSYDITIYQQNTSGDITSKHITLYRNRPGNLPPGAATLVTPADSATVQTTLVPVWNMAQDPDFDMVSYTLVVSKSSDMTNPVLVKEGLTDSYALISFEDGLLDLTTYYWHVWSIDSYGLISKSAVRSFKTDNRNGLPGLIKGYVRDVVGNPIPNATISYGTNSSTKTLANGVYLILSEPGSYSLTTTAAGYQKQTVSLYATSGQIYSNDMILSSVVPVGRAITTAISGLGLGYVNCPTTIADGAAMTCQIQPGAGYKLRNISGCGGTQNGNQFSATVTADCTVTAAFNSLIQYGDCNKDGQVSIAEVQGAINMFLGMKPVDVCVDYDNSGVGSISKVQKAINSFLGM